MKLQNRFSGVVFKKPSAVASALKEFKEHPGNFFTKSNADQLFDGYIPDLETFSHDNVSFYEGDWAACEILESRLKISRDRIGVRTIYYIDNAEIFAFANDLKGLLSLPMVHFDIEAEGAFHFLFQDHTSQLVKGVQELPLASVLTYNLNTHSIEILRYYRFERENIEANEAEVSERLRSIIEEKVRKSQHDCTGIASLLSGGLDSSVIAAALKDPPNVPFITAVSSQEAYNETPYAAEVVKHLEIKEWHQVEAVNIENEIENLHVAMELPTTSLGSFLQYELMRFCKFKGFSDVLDGTGADALFAGHNYYHAIYWNELLRSGKVKSFLNEGILSQMDENWIKYYAKNMLKYYFIPRFSVQSKIKASYRNNSLLESLNMDFIQENVMLLDRSPTFDLKRLDDTLHYDFFEGGVANLLRFPDRMGKAFGVRNHSIFSSFPQLYEYAASIPSKLKIKDGYSKYIVRKAFEDKLPVAILGRRDKMGLVAPNNYWMQKHKDLFLSYIDDRLSPYFQVEKMRDMLSKEIDKAGEVENYKVFKFISFAIWLKVMNQWA